MSEFDLTTRILAAFDNAILKLEFFGTQGLQRPITFEEFTSVCQSMWKVSDLVDELREERGIPDNFRLH